MKLILPSSTISAPGHAPGYVYEMGKILNADPTRIQVASLSFNGSVVVNTVFKVVGTWSVRNSADWLTLGVCAS